MSDWFRYWSVANPYMLYLMALAVFAALASVGLLLVAIAR
jgi:NADH:ubiquinone oxidoreductase subunit K